MCVLARPVHGLARVAIPGQLHHVTRRSVIEDFSIYAGSLKGSGGKAGLAWAKANVATIKAEWNRVNPKWPA